MSLGQVDPWLLFLQAILSWQLWTPPSFLNTCSGTWTFPKQAFFEGLTHVPPLLLHFQVINLEYANSVFPASKQETYNTIWGVYICLHNTVLSELPQTSASAGQQQILAATIYVIHPTYIPCSSFSPQCLPVRSEKRMFRILESV